MMTSATTQRALVERLRDQAEWRAMKAAEYPEDPRNASWSARLGKLAEWLETLPSDTPDLVRLDHVWGRYGDDLDVLMVGEECGRLTSRPEQGGEDWLTLFVETFAMETVEDEEDIPTLVGFADDPDPQLALPAIRRIRYWLDDCESEAVLKAQVEGMPWSEVGRQLGRTKQAVWEMYHDPDERPSAG
jgi:hypothetical protein